MKDFTLHTVDLVAEEHGLSRSDALRRLQEQYILDQLQGMEDLEDVINLLQVALPRLFKGLQGD